MALRPLPRPGAICPVGSPSTRPSVLLYLPPCLRAFATSAALCPRLGSSFLELHWRSFAHQLGSIPSCSLQPSCPLGASPLVASSIGQGLTSNLAIGLSCPSLFAVLALSAGGIGLPCPAQDLFHFSAWIIDSFCQPWFLPCFAPGQCFCFLSLHPTCSTALARTPPVPFHRHSFSYHCKFNLQCLSCEGATLSISRCRHATCSARPFKSTALSVFCRRRPTCNRLLLQEHHHFCCLSPQTDLPCPLL